MNTQRSDGDPAGIPAGAARLFPHHDESALASREHLPFLIGSLLENGDTSDLRWLVDRCGEHPIADWLRTGAECQLSARSRAFWTVVLDLETTPIEEDPLWPL